MSRRVRHLATFSRVFSACVIFNLREHGSHDSCDGCRCSVLSEIIPSPRPNPRVLMVVRPDPRAGWRSPSVPGQDCAWPVLRSLVLEQIRRRTDLARAGRAARKLGSASSEHVGAAR